MDCNMIIINVQSTKDVGKSTCKLCYAENFIFPCFLGIYKPVDTVTEPGSQGRFNKSSLEHFLMN